MFNDEMRESLQGYLMRASHKYFQKTFHRISNTDIHPGQMQILSLLDESEGLSQREIASRLKIKPPTINVSIRRLEGNGYVRRQPDERDQRITRIFLTEKGKTAKEEIHQITYESEKILEKNFTDSELCLFKRLFRQLMDNMEDLEGPNESLEHKNLNQKENQKESK